VQQVAPFFQDFQLEPLELNRNTIKLEWRHVGSDGYFDASSLSDGTLRFIAPKKTGDTEGSSSSG